MDEQKHLVENPGEDLQYGWRCWRPSWLQCLNRPAWFLVFAALGSFATGADVVGFMGATISTVEKRYNLQSKQSALILAVYELLGLPAIILVGYYGPKRNRPLWIAIGTLVFGVGSIIYTLPHFLAHPYTYDNNISDSNICKLGQSNGTADLDPCSVQAGHQNGHLSMYLGVFILASVLHSCGTVPLFTLGLPYIDDMTTRETSSLYIGIFYAVVSAGPALAYVASSYTLSVYTDISFSEGVEDLQPGDPRWVGAWWLGFLVTACLCFCLVLPQAGFPRDMPGAAALRQQKKSEVHDDGSDVIASQPGFGENIRDIPRTLVLLVRNSCFLGISLANLPDALLITGYAAYAPKILQNQFGLLPSTASVCFGLIAVPGAIGGSLTPGLVSSRKRLSCEQMLRAMFICALLGLVPVFSLVYCGQSELAGVSQPYHGSTNLSLSHTCNTGCGCSRLNFAPVCGADDVTYFSPCYAGCKVSQWTQDELTYGDCACITTANQTQGSAVAAACEPRPCHMLALFLFCAFLFMFFITFNATMSVQSVIRCVPASQRSLGVGVHWVVGRILGSLPAPIIMGTILDRACVLWDITCDEDGACLRYDNFWLAIYLFSLTLTCRVFSALCYFCAWRRYKPPKNITTSSSPTDNISVAKETMDKVELPEYTSFD